MCVCVCVFIVVNPCVHGGGGGGGWGVTARKHFTADNILRILLLSRHPSHSAAGRTRPMGYLQTQNLTQGPAQPEAAHWEATAHPSAAGKLAGEKSPIFSPSEVLV